MSVVFWNARRRVSFKLLCDLLALFATLPVAGRAAIPTLVMAHAATFEVFDPYDTEDPAEPQWPVASSMLVVSTSPTWDRPTSITLPLSGYSGLPRPSW